MSKGISLSTDSAQPVQPRSTRRLPYLRKGLPIYLMILPGLLYFIIFRYFPMGGVSIAFQDYDPFVGFLQSDWVGLEHFQRLFTESEFYELFSNTLILSFLNIVFFFPAPIFIAILLNEVRKAMFRRAIQSIVYMPHFLSWVVVVSITIILLGSQEGTVNVFLTELGYQRIAFMTDPDYFRTIYVFQNIWKETGWSAIIFLAALASIDPTLYEAAVVDGAGRWRQMWSVTLPALRSTIIIMFILRLGSVLDIGFEHLLLMQNTSNFRVADVFDSYIYRNGVLQGNFSYTTAVGLFKSVIGLILIIGSNKLAKRSGEEGVY